VFSDILFSLSINTLKNKKPLFLEGLVSFSLILIFLLKILI